MSDDRKLDELNLEVLSSTARALSDEDAFDDMVASWDKRLSVSPKQEKDGNLKKLISNLQDMMQLFVSKQRSALDEDISELVNHENSPSAIFSLSLKPIYQNNAWRDMWAHGDASSPTMDMLYPDDQATLAKIIKADKDSPDAETKCLVRILAVGEDTNFCLVSRVSGHSGDDCLHFAELSIGWSAELASLITEAYDITEAECDVAKLVMKGERPEEIAEQRGSSVATVRKQIQSLLTKCGVSSQVELAQNLSLVANNLNKPSGPMVYEWTDPWKAEKRIIRPGGHVLAYSEAGIKGGIPVLIVHGEGIGYALPEKLHQHAQEHGWHLYAIQRPGHGNSDIAENETGFEASCAAITHLCNAIIGKAAVIIAMHSSIPVVLKLLHEGTIKASHFGALNSVLSLHGDVEKKLPPVQRAWFRMARVSRKAAILATNAGWVLLKKNGIEWYLERYFSDNPADLATTKKFENRELLRSAAAMMLRQGPAALIEDILHYVEPAAKYLPMSDTKISIIFGTLNPLFDESIVTALQASNPDITVFGIEGGGELIAYSHTAEILEFITKTMSDE